MSEAVGAVAGGPKVFAVRRCEIDLRSGSKMYYCLRTPDGNESAAVDAFFKAAIAANGRDNGGPGLRPEYHPGYYGAFVLDPDGHNKEAVCDKTG